jgi:intracellular multiplication protein IcmL
MLGQRHQIARLQSDFYRDQFRKILRWLMVTVFIMFALIFVIFYLILVQPPQKFYGNTTDGRILPMPGVKSG